MRAHQAIGAAAAARGSDLPGALRRALRMGARHGGVVVIMLALGACAGRVPAPVESRVDVPEAPQSTAGIPASGLAASSSSASAVSEPSSGAVEATPETPPPAPPPAGDAAPETGSASTRLAALNPAIIDLLNAANEHSAAGRQDEAAAALERALKIEPADPGLWHRLARIRFEQGKPDLAEALAAKSNSLAAGDENLQAQNWRLIAKVRRKLGDASGAADAAARAARVLD